ncbi:MAG: NAD(P)-binding domain-containing protein [Candidatus Vogelbacteria bacterium]|nr:NAD(P)-binding domain-containing protein [Candidatus Vogelbacteria bacterium]
MGLNEKIYDLIIIGAGPAGIEAGLQAEQIGIKALLIDREEAGSVIANTMSGKRFYHAYGRNAEPPGGLLDFPDRKKGGELVDLWRKQARSLAYLPNTVFETIENVAGNGTYIIITNKGNFIASRVILATGIFSKPKRLGVSGEEGNASIAYEFDYNDFITDKKILVIGGGNSAVETALELSLDNDVLLIVRKPNISETITERNRAELEREITGGSLRIFYNSNILSFNSDEATIQISGEKITDRFDKIYINIGYESPSEWLKSLLFELAPNGLPILFANLETSRPGIFVAGALAGSDSIIGSANQAIEIIKYIARK